MVFNKKKGVTKHSDEIFHLQEKQRGAKINLKSVDKDDDFQTY